MVEGPKPPVCLRPIRMQGYLSGKQLIKLDTSLLYGTEIWCGSQNKD